MRKSIAEGIVYGPAQVAPIFDSITTDHREPVPVARRGEVVVYYEGWHVEGLRHAPMLTRRIWRRNWAEHAWAVGTAEPGYYRLLPRFAESNYLTWEEQVSQLQNAGEGWEPAPACAVLTEVIVHLATTGEDLLGSGSCRCADPVLDDGHVAIHVIDGRVAISTACLDVAHAVSLWLAAAQKV